MYQDMILMIQQITGDEVDEIEQIALMPKLIALFVLKEYKDIAIQVRELDLHSADLTKSRIVKDGDNLWAIAAKEYGDPEDWRLIAEANHIDNPRKLQPGRQLMIPVKE